MCEKKALVLHAGVVSFLPKQCSGCMLCLAVCPSDAFSCDFAPIDLLQTLAEEEDVVLSCTKKQGQQFLPCLGILSEPLLAALHYTARSPFFVDISRCLSCNNAFVLKHVQKNKAALLAKIAEGKEVKLHYLREEGVASLEEERRFFLQKMKKYGTYPLHPSPQAPPGQKGPMGISFVLQYAWHHLPTQKEGKREVLSTY
ncbi:MAG: hypothetical protein D3923_17020 [Candidatus Electrothrix sp. AR3]|nr:hypothetical protein [Candidatus Electrothrix sp. AR3]